MRYLYLLVFCLLTLNTHAQHYRLKTLTHELYMGDSLKFVPADTFNYFYFQGRGGTMPFATFAARERNEAYRPHHYTPYFISEMKYDSCLVVYVDWTGKSFYSDIKQYLDGNDNIILRNENSIPAKTAQTDSFTYVSNKMTYSYIGTGPYSYTNGIKFYHYNSLGQLDTISRSTILKTIYVYNTNGTIYRVYDIYLDNAYALFWNVRSTYNYNTSGQLTAVVSDRYDTVTATYNRNGSREFYTYTTANDNNEILKQYWDYKTSSWVNQAKRVFLHDVNHNVLFDVLIEWKNNAWDTFRCSSYTYNSQNQLTFNETKFWDKVKHSWEYKSDTFAFGNSQRFTFTYEPYFPTSITSTKANDASIKLYPVPASGVLSIEVKEAFKDSFKATILDMQGRLYTEWTEEPCSAYNRSIPINNLPNGMYFLKIVSSDGEIVKQFMVER